MDTATNMHSEAKKAVLEEARKVNAERMKAVEELAAVVAERIELEERLKENTKEEKRAVREAEKAGWTSAQIKRFMKPPRSQNKTRSPNENVPATETNQPEHTPAQSSVMGNV